MIEFIYFLGCYAAGAIAIAAFIMTALLWREGIKNGIFAWLKLGLILSVISGLFYWQVEIETISETKERSRVLVSASPSHTQLDGSVSGSFMYFSGYVNETRIYLLREEVSEGVYKDFEVKKGAYLKEDPLLKNKGRFVLHLSCKTTVAKIGGLNFKEANEYCVVTGQDIVVPVGSVIKELKI